MTERIAPLAEARQRGATAPAFVRKSDLDRAEVRQARTDPAACFRMAAKLGLQEGICNPFSLIVPGRDDLMLVNPYGRSFAEITASSLVICDFQGRVVAGYGVPEATAFYIQGRVHLKHPRAKAAFHTHMPNATALAMLEGPLLIWAVHDHAEILRPHPDGRGLQRPRTRRTRGRPRTRTPAPRSYQAPAPEGTARLRGVSLTAPG